jgi:ABC-type transport system involved in cytochrome c biogenesis ATPase subunit
MQLVSVRIERFQNFMDAQNIPVEGDVTCLVGKNESGKTTILKALHRLNPANGTSRRFNLTTEYPRSRLARDRRAQELERFCPVVARFTLDDDDRGALTDAGIALPPTAQITVEVGRGYGNGVYVKLEAEFEDVLSDAATAADVHAEDLAHLQECDSASSVAERCKELAKSLKESDEVARSKAVTQLSKELSKLTDVLGTLDAGEQKDAVWARVPKFFYFSDYSNLPGKCDLQELAEKVASDPDELTMSDETMLALLEFANEKPGDFLDENFDRRKAELQAAGSDLSQKVFEYWKQNTDLTVVFDTDMPVVSHVTDQAGAQHEVRHRVLHILLRDDRHGGVETNFETRSAGFQWFFSFLAAFSKYQGTDDRVIVLLDEPGTKLHGEAQRDFLRYIHNELGAEQQVLYTTHSQHMIDPSKYEKLRAVHDRATREDVNAGVAVTTVDLSADRDTVLPVEAALGYTVAQHLFFGSGHHLLVEGSSDFVYMQRMSEYAVSQGQSGLDPRFAAIPVGGADNFAPFVALMGRRFPLTVLMDGATGSRQHQRVERAAEAIGVDVSSIVVCGDLLDELPKSADVEDLFDTEDYLWLYSRALSPLTVSDLAATEEPVLKRITDARGVFDHALPAHELTRSATEFFGQVRPATLERFQALFSRLHATLPAD